jgi:hypothetical protein
MSSVSWRLIFLKLILLIDWKAFRIIFESIYFDKTVFRGISEDYVIFIFKMLFHINFMVFPTLNLRNYVLIEFLLGSSLVFLSKSQTVPQSDNSGKDILITTKKYRNSFKLNFIALVSK